MTYPGLTSHCPKCGARSGDRCDWADVGITWASGPVSHTVRWTPAEVAEKQEYEQERQDDRERFNRELTDEEQQQAAVYRETFQAMLEGRVTKHVPKDRLERLIREGLAELRDEAA